MTIMNQNSIRMLGLCSLLTATALPTTLDFTASDLGGGLFEYSLTVSNPISDTVSGLDLINAYTAFGLDDTSTISAPAGWPFFAPLPPFVRELNFASLDASADIPIGGSLSGFSFVSATNPANLSGSAWQHDLIAGSSGTQTPEPAAVALVGVGLILLRIKASAVRR
jgi:hypothetical protein